MNRQQRRQKKRSLEKYEKRQAFTKREIEAANEASYQYGVAFALLAAKEVLGLGETRLERLRQRIAEYEARHFVDLEEFTQLHILQRGPK